MSDPISVTDIDDTLADLQGMWAALTDLCMTLPEAGAYLATRKELPPIIAEIFQQAKLASVAVSEKAAFVPPRQYRDLTIESVAQQLEVLPLTYAGPDPQGVKNLRDLIVMAIRDMKGKP